MIKAFTSRGSHLLANPDEGVSPDDKMRGGNRLPVLAAEINRHVRRSRKHAGASLSHAIKAGEHLIEAKAILPHGAWLPWLRENGEISERTASRYMRLAKHQDVIDAKSATVADLTIKGAMAELVEPQWPDKPSRLVHVIRCLPNSGMAKVGSLDTAAGTDFFGIVESETLPGFYFVMHIWVPHEIDGESTSETLRRPIRADAVHEVVKLHAGEDFLGIDFRDVPLTKMASILEAAGWST